MVNIDNEKFLEITNNSLGLVFELKTYHLYVPPTDGVVLDFIFETGGV